MRRPLALSALALAAVSAIATSATSVWQGYALGTLDARPVEDGAIAIETSGPEGAGAIEAVQIAVALELEVDDARRLDEPVFLRVRLDDGGEEPLSELVAIDGEELSHTVDLRSWELLADCPDYPSCSDELHLGFDVVNDRDEPVERVTVAGEMVVLVSVITEPADGDLSAGIIDSAELSWISELQ